MKQKMFYLSKSLLVAFVVGILFVLSACTSAPSSTPVTSATTAPSAVQTTPAAKAAPSVRAEQPARAERPAQTQPADRAEVPARTTMPARGAVTQGASLKITTTSLGGGSMGAAYSQQLQAAGGTSPYTWSISGGSLPAGLALSSGVISGTPTASGAFSFMAQVTDNAGSTATVNLSINIQRVTPVISTTTLPAGKVGAAYSQTLAVSGGVSPYNWSITNGSLPPGLVLSSGVISGTPTADGTFNFTVQVTDSSGSTTTANLSINVTAAPIIMTTTLPGGEVNRVYSQSLAVSGGTAPYSWSISGGSLPGGLTLSNGIISGTPTTTGTFSFTVMVIDSTGTNSAANLSINIVSVPMITTTALPAGEVNTAYLQTLAASGGTAPYSWSISGGSLPGGLTLSNGTISGTPTTAGTFSFAVQLTDNTGVTITANLSITVNSP